MARVAAFLLLIVFAVPAAVCYFIRAAVRGTIRAKGKDMSVPDSPGSSEPRSRSGFSSRAHCPSSPDAWAFMCSFRGALLP